MDRFVQDAFIAAQNQQADQEFRAYKRAVLDNLDAILDHAAYKVGMDRMEDLSRAVVLNGLAETFSEFTKALVIVGFHLGYNESIADR